MKEIESGHLNWLETLKGGTCLELQENTMEPRLQRHTLVKIARRLTKGVQSRAQTWAWNVSRRRYKSHHTNPTLKSFSASFPQPKIPAFLTWHPQDLDELAPSPLPAYQHCLSPLPPCTLHSSEGKPSPVPATCSAISEAFSGESTLTRLWFPSPIWLFSFRNLHAVLLLLLSHPLSSVFWEPCFSGCPLISLASSSSVSSSKP